MYMVAFMYPAEEGTTFDYDHFVNVHLPMGVALTKKYLDIKPEKIVVYNPIIGGDGTESTADFSAISSVFFSTQAEAEKFSTLFEYEEAARLLSDDFANYTPGAPDVIMANVRELNDMDSLINRYDD